MSLEQDDLFGTPPSTSKVMTVSQARAAELCGVSPTTIRRYRQAGKIDGCQEDEESGGWLIPVRSLIACGLMPRSTPPDAEPVTEQTAESSPNGSPSVAPDVTAQKEILELKEQLAAARHRAELAEAIAAERGRALEAERLALRMLTAGTDKKEATEEPKKRFRWPWQK